MRARLDRSLFVRGRTCLEVASAESRVIVDAAAYYRAVADAMEGAERSILIAAWQIDTRVVLRRRPGEDPREQTLAAVLARACVRSPELRVRILPWNWSAVFATDREWSTAEKLSEIAEGRIECVWDSAHPPGASQHEKLVIVDGHTAFVGGIDLCLDRWDDRRHLPLDPRRIDSEGKLGRPYHDAQAVVHGAAAAELARVFTDRWARAGGEPFELTTRPHRARLPRGWGAPLAIREVAIARTRSPDASDGREAIAEVNALLREVLLRARALVYAETQYLTSRALVDVLIERMRDRNMPRLEIVLVLPRRTEGMLERAAIAGPQHAALHLLSRVAAETGHGLGVFCPAVEPSAEHAESEQAPLITYIHSKIVIVDDRFLTVGSANLTNRSMGVDAELNLAWVSSSKKGEASIRALRESLIAEHAGLPQEGAAELLGDRPTCLATLVHLALLPESRLVAHSFADYPGEHPALEELLAEIGDPEHAEDLEERARTLVERAAAVPGTLAEAWANAPPPTASTDRRRDEAQWARAREEREMAQPKGSSTKKAQARAGRTRGQKPGATPRPPERAPDAGERERGMSTDLTRQAPEHERGMSTPDERAVAERRRGQGAPEGDPDR